MLNIAPTRVHICDLFKKYEQLIYEEYKSIGVFVYDVRKFAFCTLCVTCLKTFSRKRYGSRIWL